MSLVGRSAALMIKDNEALGNLVPMIIELAKDEIKQYELKTNIGLLGTTDADRRIAEEILGSI
jgi:UDP-N-acetylglucosamine:LPS N-acetylglucosamine transferase